MRFGDGRGHYELDSLPGNQFVCWSHRAFVRKELRGKGVGHKQHLDRLANARNLGYTYILATVRGDNFKEIKVLLKNDWVQLAEVSQTEDGHPVFLWGRQL
jgi:GNAT superfamily N-acetyltransferase